MAYIQPNSIAEFFGDLNLSPNYENTLYFASVSAKDTYFSNLTKITTVSNVSYVRENRGFIRVERPMSTMYNVTYMRFKNTSFENKWFYAFVKRVNYINNTTTEIEFELDVIMTWMGVFTLNQCFVERQHSLTDAIGDNIVDEGLDYGEYINYNSTITGFFDDNTDYVTIVLTTLNHAGTEPTDTYSLYEGVCSGATPQIFMTNTDGGRNALTTFLNNVVTNKTEDAVIGIYMCPAQFVSNVHTPLICQPITKPYSSIDGYTPKNNKLFVYPYNCLEVANMEGGFNEYRYEFFSTPSVANFEIIYNFLPPVQAVLYPKNYKGITDNYNEASVMASFPNGSFAVDSYKAYLAQVASNSLVNMATGGISKALSYGMLGGVGGMVLGAVQGVAQGALQGLTPQFEKVANTLTGRSKNAEHPALEKGSTVVNAFYANHKKDFRFNCKQITNEYARTIDNYFTMFGYAIKKVMTPNMNARPNWTYVKTIGCSVGGNLPADDARSIENIFDNGVRFWKNHNNIGNYSLANAPT